MSFAIALSCAALAYALFFAYDWFNVRKPQVKAASALFPLGVLLSIASTAILLVLSLESLRVGGRFALGLLVAAISLAALVWALVFSLPKGTYVEPGERRPVHEGGAYALCRHPGVFFYCCLYAGLLVALPCVTNLIGFALLCAGNLAYMLLQDAWTFPALLAGYDDYKLRSNLFFPRLRKADRDTGDNRETTGARL